MCNEYLWVFRSKEHITLIVIIGNISQDSHSTVRVFSLYMNVYLHNIITRCADCSLLRGSDWYHDDSYEWMKSLFLLKSLNNIFNCEVLINDSMYDYFPIPKDKRKSLFISSNYMTITLSRIFDKILDWIILIKKQFVLPSSKLQFSFLNIYQ